MKIFLATSGDIANSDGWYHGVEWWYCEIEWWYREVKWWYREVDGTMKLSCGTAKLSGGTMKLMNLEDFMLIAGHVYLRLIEVILRDI